MRVLLINPNRWGRGITSIWIASHSAILKKHGHSVKLFDCTFYKSWQLNELGYNTSNLQYKKSDYQSYIKYKDSSLTGDLQNTIDDFKPDVILISAISSHLHGEGEYVNVQYGNELLGKIKTNAIKMAGGFQITALQEKAADIFKNIDIFIVGEVEEILIKFLSSPDRSNRFIYAKKPLNLNNTGLYDYSLFEDQVFYRPYQGEVVRAIDYEMSRGCIYNCSYCVETITQRYYGFNRAKNGVLLNARKYFRHKTAENIARELEHISKTFNIKMIRCQDANFLSIPLHVLKKVAELIKNLNIFMYIETRAEGINKITSEILRELKVDGVGMGVEIAEESFRKGSLNRYVSQKQLIDAFDILKKAGIKRTSYNIIGLPNQTEQMILDSISLNRQLDPDNITVAFFSPYIGTSEQVKAHDLKYFDEYENDVDGQLRTLSKSALISPEKLNYYKKNFVKLVRNG
jgi:anaerobic magnesium-protoporphyrin IX monomethyl ester cyclase